MNTISSYLPTSFPFQSKIRHFKKSISNTVRPYFEKMKNIPEGISSLVQKAISSSPQAKILTLVAVVIAVAGRYVYRSIIDKIQAEFDKLDKENKQLNQEKQQLNKQLEDLKKTHIETVDQLKRKLIIKKMKAVSIKEILHAELETQKEKAKTSVTVLEQKLKETNEQIVNFKAVEKIKNVEIAELKQKLEETNKQIVNFKTEQGIKKAVIAELEQKIADITKEQEIDKAKILNVPEKDEKTSASSDSLDDSETPGSEEDKTFSNEQVLSSLSPEKSQQNSISGTDSPYLAGDLGMQLTFRDIKPRNLSGAFDKIMVAQNKAIQDKGVS